MNKNKSIIYCTDPDYENHVVLLKSQHNDNELFTTKNAVFITFNEMFNCDAVYSDFYLLIGLL